MLMSTFNKKWLALLLAALLAACQSGPEQASGPLPEAESAPLLAPAATPGPEDINQQVYAGAIVSLKKGNTETALKLLQQVSGDAPDKPRVFTNLGLAYFKLQRLELAAQAFQEAVRRDDDDAVAHNHLGILQRRRGEFEAARESYQRAIDIDSNYAPAYLNLGILFDIYFQDLAKALQHYHKYQALISDENSQVAGWITDIERRLKSGGSSSQG